MNCRNCGAPMQMGTSICSNCGANQNMQPVYQPTYQPMYNEQPKNSNNNIILIIMIILIAVLLILLVYLTVGKNKNNNDTTKETTETKEEVAYATTTINYANYEFKVPSEYKYKYTSSGLQISDDVNWLVNIEIGTYNYNTIKLSKEQIKNNFISKGYKASNPIIKTVNGMEWLIYEVDVGGKTNIVAYGKASNTQIYGIQVVNINGTADYDTLGKVSTIVKSAKSSSGQNSISTGNIIDIGIVK